MDFRTIVTTLAAETRLSAQTIVMVANLLASAETVDLRTHAQRVAFARNNEEVMHFLNNNQRINAIKVLRDATKGGQFVHAPYMDGRARDIMGLKEAKEATDAILPPRYV